MKFLLIIVLTIFGFQSWTKADDISDFQIEGMSIGDSLLDFYTKKEIKKFMKDYYPKSKKFYLLENDFSKYKNYENVQFAFKKKDKKFLIYGISGAIFYEKNIKECLPKMREIEKELNIIFKNTEIKQYGEAILNRDDTDKSKQLAQTQYLFSNGGVISIECTDWSEKFTKKYNYIDNLSITIYSNEYADFVRYEAY